MTYVIAQPCIDVVDRACEPACPVEAGALGVDSPLVTGWPRAEL